MLACPTSCSSYVQRSFWWLFLFKMIFVERWPDCDNSKLSQPLAPKHFKWRKLGNFTFLERKALTCIQIFDGDLPSSSTMFSLESSFRLHPFTANLNNFAVSTTWGIWRATRVVFLLVFLHGIGNSLGNMQCASWGSCWLFKQSIKLKPLITKINSDCVEDVRRSMECSWFILQERFISFRKRKNKESSTSFFVKKDFLGKYRAYERPWAPSP